MGRFGADSRGHGRLKSHQRGAVAVVVGLTLAVMIGMGGLALDLGRLFINKTELQTASDACALAASRELICDTSKAGACPAQFLVNAEAAGVSAAARNNRDMQGPAVTIAPADVRFSTVLSPNNTYLSRLGGADTRSKFVMCTARSNGIVPWLMGVVGLGNANNVASTSVATLAPAMNYCLGPPIGICTKNVPGSSPLVSEPGPDFGYVNGEWIEATFTGGNKVDLGGAFRWVDFTPSAGGTPDIEEGLTGAGGICGVKVTDAVDVIEPGTKQGSKDAYNTRFGIYSGTGGPNEYTVDNAPPDRTGYAYPTTTITKATGNAYADYRSRQASGTPFDDKAYQGTGKVNGKEISSADHLAKGSNRRLIAVPFVSCNATNSSIVGTACVLMINPMSNGANGTIFLEYIDNGSSPASPCAAFGSPGGPGSLGPLVPTLVQ